MNDSIPTARPSWRMRLAQGAVLSATLAIGVGAAQLLPAHAAFAADGVAGLHGDLREEHRARMHEHMQRVLADAGTTQAQRNRIEALVRGAMEAQHADMERLHADMKLLGELLVAPTIDTARVATVRAEQEQIALQTARRVADTALAVAQQLTPQQRKAVGTEIERMFERHHGGPFGGPHGDGPRGEGPRGEGPRGEGPPRG